MTVIVISCTNCLLFIRAVVSMGSAGQLLMGTHQNPQRGRGRTRSPARSAGFAAQPGLAGKGEEEKIPPGLLPKNTTRACFARRGAAPALAAPRRAGAALPHRAPRELLPVLTTVPLCPAAPGPHRGTCVGPGVAAPPGMCFSLDCFAGFPRRCSRRGG